MINCYGLIRVLVYVIFYVFKQSCVICTNLECVSEVFYSVFKSASAFPYYIIDKIDYNTHYNCVFFPVKDALGRFFKWLDLDLYTLCLILICKAIGYSFELPNLISFWFSSCYNKYCCFYYFYLKKSCFYAKYANCQSMECYTY